MEHGTWNTGTWNIGTRDPVTWNTSTEDSPRVLAQTVDTSMLKGFDLKAKALSLRPQLAIWNLGLGIRNLELGTWNSVHWNSATWNLELGNLEIGKTEHGD